MLSLSFIKEIEKIIGRENVLTGEADRQNYAYDAAVLPPVVPGLVVRPTRTDQLGPLIQKCYEEGIPITIRGSGTNLSGGTIPDSTDAVIILTNSLDRILEINEEEMYAVVEPGVITCDLAAAVAARGLFYPPDPGSMSVSTMGGTPVFYDVCADTFNADAKSLEAAIEAVIAEGKLTPKAVVDVDLFGLPADHEAVAAVCKKHGLLFLEDAAQGFGGMLHGKRNGAFGDAACTSFFPAKPLGCYGDGGAVFTDSDETAAMIRSLCVHGKGSFKYDNVRIGMNSRLDTIQAAILLVKMDALEKYELADVNAAAAMYNEALAGIPAILPVVPEGWYSSWAQYTLRLRSREERDRVQSELKAQGIPTMVYYPKPMHTQQAFDGLKQYIPCPVTEELCATVLSLPMHPYLTRETVQTVADALRRALK